jgi:hypothetical protein
MVKSMSEPGVYEDARRKGIRGRRKANAGRAVMIEGQYVTLSVIAQRIGKGESAASSRLRREQAKPGPVTWAGLSA